MIVPQQLTPRTLILVILVILFDLVFLVFIIMSSYQFESFSVHFTGKNFLSWEFHFQIFVTEKELWGRIDGADPGPTDSTKLGE